MYDIDQIKDTFERAMKQYNTLLSIYSDEVKEYGKPKENTISSFNALFFQLQEATKHIENGLDGKF